MQTYDAAAHDGEVNVGKPGLFFPEAQIHVGDFFG